jgi:integrase/recombinase XerD
VAQVSDEQLLIDFFKDCKLRNMTQKTVENYKSATKIFSNYLHEVHLNLLSLDGVENKDILEDFYKYLTQKRQVSHARVKIYFSALNCLYDFLEYKGFIKNNIVLIVRRRYVRQYKKGYVPAQRKIIDVEDMKNFLNSIVSLRDKTIALLFVKTGMRRGELISIDIDNIDFVEKTITLKPAFHKRSNRTLFFDEECEKMLKQWILRRKYIAHPTEKALFVNDFGKRLQRSGVYEGIVKWAKRYYERGKKLPLFNGKSDRLEDHFSCHNLRHCFTTYLRRNGMPREFIRELRGDQRREVIDIYYHIDYKDLKKSYLACMPKFDVY